ncbi:MAG: hypothetical protein KC535_05440 [Nanoarchaeota archaeon]|nr:hypothetical protein [Nanoarchaeota archaeon]
MTSLDKKAVMGIGTLIIFIATILVAAVAAAVLISTSNVLQQRSLLVGQEARKAITDGVEVVSILAASDAASETFNQYEIMIRLSPGSDPLQMRHFNLQYIGPDFDDGTVLTYSDNETSIDPGVVNDAGYSNVYDLDGDGSVDSVILVIDAFGSDEGLQFNLSDAGASDLINLGVDLSNAGTTNVFIDLPDKGIYVGEDYYGVVSVSGTTTTDDQIDAAVTINVSEFVSVDDCSFAALPFQNYYCYEVVNGNDDYVLSSGERYKLLYQVVSENELTVGEDFGFIFTTDKGRLSEARARTPDVITTTKTKLWPLG